MPGIGQIYRVRSALRGWDGDCIGMTGWELAYVLPNLKIDRPFQALSGQFALVSFDDERLGGIKENPLANSLLNGFHDAQGRLLKPAALIARTLSRDLGALVDFRNIVAVSVILPAWAELRPNAGSPQNPLWSEAFNLYPVTVGPQSLITATPALLGVASWRNGFAGMPDPAVPVYGPPIQPDFRLLGLLLREWERRHVQPGRDTWKLRTLFRSLESAYRALAVPRDNEGSLYDLGNALAQWVSAFETLVHPWQKKATVESVIELLEQVAWSDPRLRQRRYRVKVQGRTMSVTGISRLYHEIYQARNAFLHGNVIRTKHWRHGRGSGATALLNLPPVVYRAALLARLGRFTRPLAKSMVESNMPRVTGDPWRGVNLTMAFVDERYEDRLKCLLGAPL